MGLKQIPRLLPAPLSASTSALVLGAYDRNATAAATGEIKNIAAAGHSGIKLDEVRIYNKGLTATEVANIYNFGKGDLEKIGGFSTLPTTVKANGTAFYTTVTADFSNAVYDAYNLPNGLSINSSTGEISGTPTVGGTHPLQSVQGGTNLLPKSNRHDYLHCPDQFGPKFGTPRCPKCCGDSSSSIGRNRTVRCFFEYRGHGMGYIR